MPAEQRRFVTILFGDIVGSTSIAEKLDPEDWRQNLEIVHKLAGDLILKYHGQVLQYLGDGILAIFGANHPSERDPEQAIRAALEIVQLIPSLPTEPALQMRAGVHTGLVVLGELGGEAKRELTASGDAMNLAQRLQSLAEPETVMISHETYPYVRGLFDILKQEPLSVKGRKGNVQPYLVRGYKERPFRMVARGVGGLKTATVGRTAEMAQLNKQLHDVLAHERLIWSQIIAEPGLGKTRLLGDMTEALDLLPEGLCLLRSQALEGDIHRPYAAIRRLWFDRFQITEDAPAAEVEALWTDRLRELLGPGHTLETLALGMMIGLSFGAHPSSGILRDQPGSINPLALRASHLLVRTLRGKKPLILLLEDLQWADNASWETLIQVFLSDAAGAPGTLILATTRPDWSPPLQLLSHPSYQHMPLAPLSRSDSEELLRQLLQLSEALPREVLARIIDRAEGVPYFLEEMINWFIDQGALDIRQHPWRFIPERIDEAMLPQTLHHLLSTRLNALGDGHKRILQAGAIFGRNFWAGGLEVLGVGLDLEAMEGLEQRGFIQPCARSSFSAEQEWRFHHNLMQVVAYESVLKRTRRSHHLAAMGWLEQRARDSGRLEEYSGVLGYHAELAGERHLAVDWYLMHDEVLSHLGEIHQRREQLEHVLQLSQETLDPQKQCEVLYHFGWFLHSLGEYQQSLEYLTRGLAMMEPGEDPRLEGLILATSVTNQTRLGQLEAAEQNARRALGLTQQIVDEKIRARILTNIAMFYTESGDIGHAAELYLQQIEINCGTGEVYGEAIGRMNVGYLYLQLGLFEQGRVSLEQACSLFAELQARRMGAYCRLNLGLAYCRAGQSEHGQTLILEQAYPEFEASQDRYAKGVASCYLGLCYEASKDYLAARDAFQGARAMLIEINVPGPAMDALAGLVRCELALGQVEEACEHTEALWSFLSEQGTEGMEFPLMAYQACGRVFEGCGQHEQAERAWKEGYEELMTRADRISDERWRRSFLENVPEHNQHIEVVNGTTFSNNSNHRG